MAQSTSRIRRTRKSVLAFAAVVALATAGVVAPTTAASAAAGAQAPVTAAAAAAKPPAGYGGPTNSCPGSVYATIEIGGPSYILVWYSTANGGTFCAKTFDNLDGSHSMAVSIRREDWKTTWSDSGTFSTYAGGVMVYGVAELCAYIGGRVTVNGAARTAGSFIC